MGAMKKVMLSLGLLTAILAVPAYLVRPSSTLRPPLELRLAGASVMQNGENPLFVCQAVIVNRTGGTLRVLSNFFSAFDGLTLVVEAEGGRELARQPYVRHRSPYSAVPRPFPLAWDNSAGVA